MQAEKKLDSPATRHAHGPRTPTKAPHPGAAETGVGEMYSDELSKSGVSVRCHWLDLTKTKMT